MKFTFDKPPALNGLYVNNRWGGKTLSKSGVAWKEKALWEIRVAHPTKITEPASLTVDLYTCRHQDNDSILKVLQDTLQDGGVIEDDYLIFDLRVIKHKCSLKEEKVEVEILPLDISILW